MCAWIVSECMCVMFLFCSCLFFDVDWCCDVVLCCCHDDTRQQHRRGGCERAGTGTEEIVPVDVAEPLL